MTRPHRRRRTRRRTDSAPLSIYDPIYFGIDEYGLPVEVTLMYRNLLDGGEPGSGKSSLLNTIIAHVALCSDARLWLFDGKIVELGLWRPIADMFVGNSITDALTRLRELQAEMDIRYRLLDAVKRRKIVRDRRSGRHRLRHRRSRLLHRHHRHQRGTGRVPQPRPRPGRPGTRRRHHRHRRHPTALGRHHSHQSAGPVRVPCRLPLHHRLIQRHHPVRRLGQGRLLRQEHPPRRHRRRMDPRRRRYPTPVQGRIPDRRADRIGHQHRPAHAWHRPGRINPNPIQQVPVLRLAPAIRTTGGVCPCSP